MIVNQTDTGWQIIYHRAHALVAAQLAGQWHRQKAPIRLYETIAAISHHDDLEKEWEEDQLTKAGAPLDFTLNQTTSVEQLAKMVDDAIYRGRWVAMLTSMHLCFLNSSQRGESAEIDQFLDQQLKRQKQWQKELDVSPDVAAEAYAFMRWCDRLSLILCQQQLPAAERALEITAGPDGQRYDVVQLKNGAIAVKPWPFEAKQFSIEVDAVCLSQMIFSDNKTLTKALQEAPMQRLEWKFEKV